MRTRTTRADYSGDVGIEHGGTYFNLDRSDLRYGYCTAVRITDLDSGCGFDGAVLIEKGTINGFTDRKRIRQALECCGWETKVKDKTARRMMIAEALMSYGHFEVDEDFSGRAQEIIQTREDGPMKFDGWKAEKRVSTNDLRGYVENKYVDWSAA